MNDVPKATEIPDSSGEFSPLSSEELEIPDSSREFSPLSSDDDDGGMISSHSEVPVAGFDPIFFLHHCNVDRQFALWQALNEQNPENWFDNLQQPYDDNGTWNIPKNSVVTPETALAPFHKNSQGDYFNPNDIKDWLPLGYSYPELQPWLEEYKTGGTFNYAKYTQAIRNQLKVLYMQPAPPSLHEPSMSDIIVNVTYDRFAFDGVPYTIYLFVGDKAEYDSYRDDNNQPNPIYGTGTEGRGCTKCETKAREHTRSRGQIPLTAALLARVGLKPGASPGDEGVPKGIQPLLSLERDKVNDYLGEFLHWKVQLSNGTEVPVPDEDAFIQVSAFHRAAPSGDYDSDESYLPLKRATQGKPGGATPSGGSA
ncbi:hypothetical protein B0I37DRAFT_439152 [Chaetomium sp. MPI-CAGE-AT-0009]|nr:hypothetical protein B0I37DRAFT_439152 [Chaetomium sp. MPI-CAGE-AT-0009]